VRRKCVHPGNLRRRHPRNDRPVPRNSLKNQMHLSFFLSRGTIR
jgi:hypothetical protein